MGKTKEQSISDSCTGCKYKPKDEENSLKKITAWVVLFIAVGGPFAGYFRAMASFDREDMQTRLEIEKHFVKKAELQVVSEKIDRMGRDVSSMGRELSELNGFLKRNYKGKRSGENF